MTSATLTLEQELWMMDHIKPAPEVLVFCYVSMIVKDWVLIWKGTRKDFSETKRDWLQIARDRYASAIMVRVYFMPESKPIKVVAQ